MASFFSHPAYPVALALTRRFKISPALFILCLILTCLPDADVVAFRLGIPYESPWGHRGFTHSIFFAIVTGLFCMLFSRPLKSTRTSAFFWTFSSTLSHSILDALTNGGLGVAFFWPMTDERYFFPLRPIQVSPIGVSRFFGPAGLKVLLSEILWVWLPCLTLSVLVRKRKSLP